MIILLLITVPLSLWLTFSMVGYLFKWSRGKNGNPAYTEDPEDGTTLKLVAQGLGLFLISLMTFYMGQPLIYDERSVLPAATPLLLLLLCFFPLMVRGYRVWRVNHPKMERPGGDARMRGNPTFIDHFYSFLAKTGVLIGLLLACLLINALIMLLFGMKLGSIPGIVLFVYVIVHPFRKFRAWYNRKNGLGTFNETVDPDAADAEPGFHIDTEEERRAQIEQNTMLGERARMNRR